MNDKHNSLALRLSLFYCAISAGWILISDRLVAMVVSDPSRLTLVQTYKGWAFITVTAVLLYIVLRRQFRLLCKAEAAQAQLAVIVQCSDDAIIGKLLDGTITSWNPGAARLFGYDAEEIIGKNVSLLIPVDRAGEEADFQGRLEHGDAVRNCETARRRKDGTLLDVSIAISPLRDAGGKICGAASIIRDISPSKHAEQALQEQREQYRKVVEMSADGLFVLQDRKFVLLNSAALKIFGARSSEELLGRSVFDFIHEDCRGIIERRLELAQRQDELLPLMEETLLRLDGSTLVSESSSTRFQFQGRPAVLVGIRDITPRANNWRGRWRCGNSSSRGSSPARRRALSSSTLIFDSLRSMTRWPR